jgi:hypothetical protein
VALVLVVVGRLERAHHADVQNARIKKVLDAVGPIGNPTLDAYRVRTDFNCLLYKRGAAPYALEICIDHRGRVIEAIDRRQGTPWIGSVREEHGLATNRVSLGEVRRLMTKMGAQSVGYVPWGS